jgi:CBS domain-containing protein
VLEQLSPLSTLLAWLGCINVVLALFNLIPGFPLDGGRILRSILWALTDSLKRATRWAAGVGHLVAWTMIISGIAMAFGAHIPFFGTGLINGLWLAFIGWFLNGAASQSYRQVIVRDILEDVPVSRVMRSNPPIVSGECSVSSLVHDHVMRTDDHAFPVMKEGQLIGLTTLEDIRSVDRHAWDGTIVREIMTPAERLATVSPDDNTADALQTLARRDVRQLPVMHNGGLVGLLRRRDIVKWLQLQSEMS